MKKNQSASPKLVKKCNDCKLIEAKAIIWNNEAETLSKIIDEIQGFMPTYGIDVKLINRIKESCEELLEERLNFLDGYLDFWQECTDEHHRN
ncbi:hypothetical protein DYH10_00895 [Candidatus Saccharibacteria bacterium CPR2]|nr:hypothetical protein [Candidatus Saccharibacteria bacterium CPR2]